MNELEKWLTQFKLLLSERFDQLEEVLTKLNANKYEKNNFIRL